MNIDDLTIGEAKELAGLFGQSKTEKHPWEGQMVIAVLPNGFIHFGTLNNIGSRYMLTEASNLRYWSKRDGGLPEFAEKGPIEGDKIDLIGNVCIESVLFFYRIGVWDE